MIAADADEFEPRNLPAAGADSLRLEVEERGYAFLPKLLPGETSDRVGARFGEVIEPSEGRSVQQLIPRVFSTPNTYSGNFGLARFPFHTDLAQWPTPPRYLMLRCVVGYPDVPTLIIDGRALVEALGIELAARAVVRPRRPQDGGWRLLRLFDDHSGAPLLRWDSLFLKPASRIGFEAFAEIGRLIDAAPVMAMGMAEPADTLIIDNWRMLHGRPAIPPDRHDRCLERVYLRSLS